MSGTNPPRNVIYYSSGANQISLAGIANLPYTDVIIAFLIPGDNLVLTGAGGAFDDNLQSNIQKLQNAGKNVLISVGGGAGWPSSAYESYAQNVNGLVDQLVTNWVTKYGFDGVDIDYEDDNGFTGGATGTGTYDGVGFLIALTNGLAQALPQKIITHAPQTPYWDPLYNNAYNQIWKGAGDQITWINNQFYNNSQFDATPDLKVEWYDKIASTTGAQKLMVGAPVAAAGAGEGYIPLDQMISQVIQPLKAAWGPEFGGVMGWEFALDEGGTWAEGIWQALAGPGTTFSAPSVAQVGKQTVIAAQGPDNSLAFYWQPIGSGTWNPEQVAGQGTTSSAPSVAQVGNQTVIAAQGPNNSLAFYWQPIGSGTWNPEQVAGPGTTFSAPSVAQVGKQTVIAAQGPNNSLVFYWQPIGSGTWDPVQQVAGPGTTFSAPSVAQVGNQTVIAAQGPNNSLVFYWQPIGSGTWNPEQVAGQGTTSSAPSVAQVGNQTVIAAQGPNNSLAFYWQPIGATAWNPVQQVAGPGTTFSAPSVAQVGKQTVIAAQGPDNSLVFYWQPIGSGTWNPEQVAGQGTTSSAPSVAQVGNQTVIAAQGPNNSLAFYWQPIGSGTWNPEQVA